MKRQFCKWKDVDAVVEIRSSSRIWSSLKVTAGSYRLVVLRLTIKVLYFDRNGWCIWAKRLEQGRFLANWEAVNTREVDWTGLKLLLEGIEPKRVHKRYQKPSKNASLSTTKLAI
jgi:hypothetical protein